jgi:hypothetical protein
MDYRGKKRKKRRKLGNFYVEFFILRVGGKIGFSTTPQEMPICHVCHICHTARFHIHVNTVPVILYPHPYPIPPYPIPPVPLYPCTPIPLVPSR